ncbi:MAG: hypothetical protein NXI32_23475 [bacterium]|nr:hypothetical protein [bacterium]
MWKHSFNTATDLAADALWPTLVDIKNWADLDEQIESIEIDGPAEIGKLFYLKPKGGPRLKLRVTELQPAAVYADLCYMPLAKMKTIHRLVPTKSGTNIITEINIYGIMSFFWSGLIGKKHARGIAAMNKKLIERARETSGLAVE